jgi:hypothetical protein
MKNLTIIGCCLLVVLGFFLESSGLQTLRNKLSPAGEIVIEANIAQGANIELFVNRAFDVSYPLAIEPGVWKKYHFKALPGFIDYLRIDPTDKPDTAIALRSIAFRNAGQSTYQYIDLSKIKSSWHIEGAHLSKEDIKEQVDLLSKTNDPMLVHGALALGSSASTSWVTFLCANLHILVIFSIALFLFSTPLDGVVGLHLVLGLITAIIGGVIANYILGSFHFPVKGVSQAIGHANYVNHSKSGEIVFLLVVLVICGLMALCLASISSAIFAIKNFKIQINNPARFSPYFVFGLIILFIFITLPSISELQHYLNVQHPVDNFDYVNIFTWQALQHFGFLPFKDYWFPYGGLSDQLGLLPAHLFRNFIDSTIIFIALLLSIYTIFRYNKLPTLLFLCLLGLAISNDWLLGTHRYLMSLSILLGYLALIDPVEQTRSNRYYWLGYALLGILIGWVFRIEANQVVYASAGLIVALIFSLLLIWSHKELKAHLYGHGIMLVCSALIIIRHILKLIANDQLDGFLSFYKNMSAMAISSSIVAPLAEWLTLNSSVNAIVVLGLITSIFCGLALITLAWKHGSTLQRDGLILFTIGLIGTIVFLKMLIRPHMGKQVLIFSLAGPIIILLARIPYYRPRQKYAGSLLLGIILALSVTLNQAQSSLMYHLNFLGNFPFYPQAVLKVFDTAKIKSNNYFHSSRFINWPAGGQEVVAYLEAKLNSDIHQWGNSLYVLGDNSMFYLALMQKPPRYLTFYDGANLDAQTETVEWLRKTKPRFVIFEHTFKVFDNVPNTVRVPLIFDHIISDYRPIKTFGNYHILELSPDKPIDLNFWQSNLTNSIDLGAIPLLAKKPPHEQLCKQTPHCNDYVIITDPAPQKGEPLSLILTSKNGTFTVNWLQDTPTNTYIINLDRLWFWKASKRLNHTVKLSLSKPDAQISYWHEANQTKLY